MSQVITITGVTVAAGSSQTLELETLYLPPIKSILKAEQIINPHTHVFSGGALATHVHDMRVIGGQGAAGTNTVTCPTATDIFGKQEVGDSDVLGVNSATVGGVMAITAGTPAGTNVAGQPTRAELTVVTVTPTATNKIQRYGNTTLKMWLTTAMTVNDVLVLTIEDRGGQVRP